MTFEGIPVRRCDHLLATDPSTLAEELETQRAGNPLLRDVQDAQSHIRSAITDSFYCDLFALLKQDTAKPSTVTELLCEMHEALRRLPNQPTRWFMLRRTHQRLKHLANRRQRRGRWRVRPRLRSKR